MRLMSSVIPLTPKVWSSNPASTRPPIKTNCEDLFLRVPEVVDFARSTAADIRDTAKGLVNMMPWVCFLGGARIKEDDPSYQLAMELGRRCAQEGIPVMAGGAGGIMEAAPRGAKAADPKAVTLSFNIILENESKANDYVDNPIFLKNFHIRKPALMFPKKSKVSLFFPGGFGTFDELFTLLTLIQTEKAPKQPIILVGKEFWEPLWRTVSQLTLSQSRRTVSPEDLELIHIKDSPDEIMELIREAFAED